MGIDPSQRHGVCDDFAWRRRTSRLLRAHPAQLLRRRSRHLRQPHQTAAVFDLNFGSQIQIYYLVAFWTLIAAIAMYALTRTPLGRMCNAVRDNPERVQFVGYDPHVVRYLAFCFAGFFAGIAGALAAINFEIANSAYLGAVQSGTVLFATYIGGVGFFIGPIIGAIFVTLPVARLSDLTVGVAALFRTILHRGRDVCTRRNHRPSDDASTAGPKAGTLGTVLPSYLVAFVPTLAMIAGLMLAIEIDRSLHRQLRAKIRIRRRSAFNSMRPARSPGCWPRHLSSSDFSWRAKPGPGSGRPGTMRRPSRAKREFHA